MYTYGLFVWNKHELNGVLRKYLELNIKIKNSMSHIWINSEYNFVLFFIVIVMPLTLAMADQF